MSRFALLLVLCVFSFTAAPAFADDPKPKKKVDQSERILGVLALEFDLLQNANINEIPLMELMQLFSKKYEVTVRIDEESFKAAGQPDIKDEKPKGAATDTRDVTVHQFLTTTLENLGATYLIRNGAIDVVPVSYAAEVTKSETAERDGARARLKEPLVSVVVKEKPLNEVVAKVAEMYDLTAIFLPQAGDAKTGFVSARLLNVPADKAIDLLALQCDLRVVRRGAAFVLTSKDHANELFGEKLDKERQKIEVQKLREAPAKPPEPQPAPAPLAPGAPAPKM